MNNSLFVKYTKILSQSTSFLYINLPYKTHLCVHLPLLLYQLTLLEGYVDTRFAKLKIVL